MVNEYEKINSHEGVLEAIVKKIEISKDMYNFAEQLYKKIEKHLDRSGSTLKELNPRISPQGSFLQGTVIKPINDKNSFDLDLICNLQSGNKNMFEMYKLKEKIGMELEDYVDKNQSYSKPINGRRCWTLNYKNNTEFHMDILPAIPDQLKFKQLLLENNQEVLANNESYTKDALAITDNKHQNYCIKSTDWPISNPQGFANWFESQQKNIVSIKKQAIFEASRRMGGEPLYASVDAVPFYEVKTPLQKAIQLLKWHRNIMFGDDDEKPISIIITTLSAKSYRGEQSIEDTLASILGNMHRHIIERKGVSCVENPIVHRQNSLQFIDKIVCIFAADV